MMRSLLTSVFFFTATAFAELPKVKIVPKGFDASEADISAVLKSTTKELWKHFPNVQLEPIVVVRGENGPITLFDRNARGEIIVQLDTHRTYWSQYSYQWAHEFCHILAGFRNDARENKWFEETLCEMASLYAMRRMSETWEHDPPYKNWKDYRHSLKDYVDKVMNAREKITVKNLPEFYQKHRKTLRQNATERELNGAIAQALLPLFEKQPSRWEAIRYLNTTAATKGLSLREYFAKWHNDAPEKHQPFIRELGFIFGLDK